VGVTLPVALLDVELRDVVDWDDEEDRLLLIVLPVEEELLLSVVPLLEGADDAVCPLVVEDDVDVLERLSVPLEPVEEPLLPESEDETVDADLTEDVDDD